VLVVRARNVGVCGEDAPWTWGAGGLRFRARDCALVGGVWMASFLLLGCHRGQWQQVTGCVRGLVL
jgi:hypothetical protein